MKRSDSGVSAQSDSLSFKSNLESKAKIADTEYGFYGPVSWLNFTKQSLMA